MGVERVLFKSEEKKSSREIAAALRQIADKVEEGKLTLAQGENTVDLDFPGEMVLEIKVEEEEGRKLKKSLEIELEWIPGDDAGGETKIL